MTDSMVWYQCIADGIDPKAELALMTVYPNPFQNTVTITIPEGVSDLTLRLFDMQGRLYREDKIIPGTEETTLDLSDYQLASGLYLLHAQSLSGQRTFKLLKP